MQIADLSQQTRVIPDKLYWTSVARGLETEETTEFKKLRSEFKYKFNLNQKNVYENKWQGDLYERIAASAYPLSSLIGEKRTVPTTREFLAHWELYYSTIVPYYTTLFAAAKLPIRKKILRTVHFGKDSIEPVSSALRIIEYNAKCQIDWRKIVLGTGVDDTREFNTANMRAWANKITCEMRTADLIFFDQNAEDDDATAAIIFSLINLCQNGHALIALPTVAHFSFISVLYLIANFFEHVTIIQLTADDAFFLYCENLILETRSKDEEALYNFIDKFRGASNLSLFSNAVLERESFIDFTGKIHAAYNQILERRTNYYYKIFRLASEINKAYASNFFEKYIEDMIAENYKDISAKWAIANNFTFLKK